MKTQGIRILLVLAILAATVTLSAPAMAQVYQNDPRVTEMHNSRSYQALFEAVKLGECKLVSDKKSVCNSKEAAREANWRLADIKEVIADRFGPSLAPDAYDVVLAAWADLTFEDKPANFKINLRNAKDDQGKLLFDNLAGIPECEKLATQSQDIVSVWKACANECMRSCRSKPCSRKCDKQAKKLVTMLPEEACPRGTVMTCITYICEPIANE